MLNGCVRNTFLPEEAMRMSVRSVNERPFIVIVIGCGWQPPVLLGGRYALGSLFCWHCGARKSAEDESFHSKTRAGRDRGAAALKGRLFPGGMWQPRPSPPV